MARKTLEDQLTRNAMFDPDPDVDRAMHRLRDGAFVAGAASVLGLLAKNCPKRDLPSILAELDTIAADIKRMSAALKPHTKAEPLQ